MKLVGSAPVPSFKSLFAKYILTVRSKQARCLPVLCNSSAGAGAQPRLLLSDGSTPGYLIPAGVLHLPKQKVEVQMIPKFYVPEKTSSQLA